MGDSGGLKGIEKQRCFPNSGLRDIGAPVTKMSSRENVFQGTAEIHEPISSHSDSHQARAKAVVVHLTGALPSPTAREDHGASWARLDLLCLR